MDVRRAQRDQIVEEERFSKYLKERRAQMEEEVKGMEADHAHRLQALGEIHADREAEAEKAYQVDIARIEDNQRQKLAESRQSHEKEVKQEQESREKEFEKIRESERARVDAYRRKQDEIIEDLHKKYQAAKDDLDHHNGG